MFKLKAAQLRPMYLPPDPASRTTYLPGDVAHFDFWFPPITLDAGHGAIPHRAGRLRRLTSEHFRERLEHRCGSMLSRQDRMAHTGLRRAPEAHRVWPIGPPEPIGTATCPMSSVAVTRTASRLGNGFQALDPTLVTEAVIRAGSTRSRTDVRAAPALSAITTGRVGPVWR